MENLNGNEVDLNRTDVGAQKTESEQQLNPSDETVLGETFPKWQKMLPKEYWGSEKLAKYDSLTAVIEDAINPKQKAPEKYDLKLANTDLDAKVSDLFKKADVSADYAKQISDIFTGAMPKVFKEEDAKEVYGLADYEVVKAYKDNAVNKVCGTNQALRDKIVTSSFYNDPSFVEFARIVGKNLGTGKFEDFTNEPISGKPVDVWATMVGRPKDYRAK